MYTTHGFHIQGTTMPSGPPPVKAPCGGPGSCQTCTDDYMTASAQLDRETIHKPSRCYGPDICRACAEDARKERGKLEVPKTVRPTEWWDGIRRSYPDEARRIVLRYVNDSGFRPPNFESDEVYVVWFCYILGGWKALVSTTIPDDTYYEVTYNQGKDETYLDVYVKRANYVIKSDKN